MAWRCWFLAARRSQHGRHREHPTHWLISTQVASLLKARRDLRASQFERQNRFDRDDAGVAATPAVKEVRFDAHARTPASAIVSESDGDSPLVASPRKLYIVDDAPVRINRSAAVHQT